MDLSDHAIETSDSGQLIGALGLDPTETALLKQMLGELVAPLGIDGGQVVDGLSEGKPLADVLGLPAGLTEVLYARAYNWFTAGRHDRAEALFRILCVLDSSVADFWVGHGICLAERKELTEAVLAFATAAALRPDWAVPHFHAAQLAIAKERWRVARDHLVAFAGRDLSGLPKVMRHEASRQLEALQLRDELRSTAAMTETGIHG